MRLRRFGKVEADNRRDQSVERRNCIHGICQGGRAGGHDVAVLRFRGMTEVEYVYYIGFDVWAAVCMLEGLSINQRVINPDSMRATLSRLNSNLR